MKGGAGERVNGRRFFSPFPPLSLSPFLVSTLISSKAVLRTAMLEEHFFTCPYCWQEISMLLDLSVEEQSYTEDCEVCCRPILIHYETADEALVAFDASQDAG